MSLLSSLVLAYVAVVGPRDGGLIRDSFLRDDVKPEDFPRLTENARRGRTHFAASGSGFFITKDGYILTNHHVVDGAKEVVVIRKGTAYLADVVARNKELDLGLLKINLFPRATNGTYVVNGFPTMPALEFSECCKVGQMVYAIGFPKADILGYEPKVTSGIVNSLTGMRGNKNAFQLDAGMDHGNSGGPVVNEYGYVVGVAVSGYTGSSNAHANYAVNLNSIHKFLPSNVKVSHGVPERRTAPEKMSQKVIDSLVFILIYNEGACERITSTVTDPADARNRENATRLKKAMLDAKWCKLKKEWKDILEITDWILDVQGDVG